MVSHRANLAAAMEELLASHPLIAGEKAGIIREKGDVVIYGQSPEVEKVFYDKAMEKHATCTRSGNETAVVKQMDVTGTVFSFGPWRNPKRTT